MIKMMQSIFKETDKKRLAAFSFGFFIGGAMLTMLAFIIPMVISAYAATNVATYLVPIVATLFGVGALAFFVVSAVVVFARLRSNFSRQSARDQGNPSDSLTIPDHTTAKAAVPNSEALATTDAAVASNAQAPATKTYNQEGSVQSQSAQDAIKDLLTLYDPSPSKDTDFTFLENVENHATLLLSKAYAAKTVPEMEGTIEEISLAFQAIGGEKLTKRDIPLPCDHQRNLTVVSGQSQTQNGWITTKEDRLHTLFNTQAKSIYSQLQSAQGSLNSYLPWKKPEAQSILAKLHTAHQKAPKAVKQLPGYSEIDAAYRQARGLDAPEPTGHPPSPR